MSYQKPGVEIAQVQKSVTPILTTPDLTACLVGHSYWWQDPLWVNSGDPLQNSMSSITYSGVSTQVALSGINNQYYDVSASPALTIVDLIGVGGTYSSEVFNLTYGSHFTVANNVVTISAGISVYRKSTGTTVTLNQSATDKFNIRVGFRAFMPVGSGFNDLASMSDVKNVLGSPVSFNSLAFGAQLAMNNANAQISTLGINPSVTGDSDIKSLIDDVLSLKEVYVIAPMLQQLSLTSMKAHVDSLSTPANKKERIGFVSPVISYGGDATTLSTTAKNTIAETIRDNNAIIQDRRVFSVHPDAAYVLETRHISTLSPTWIKASFANETSIDFESYGPYAVLVNDVTIPGVGIRYRAGTKITSAVWTNLMKYDITGTSSTMTVLVPVPGYFYSAVAAGQIISKEPQAPLTNVPGTGLARTYGSQDLFTEAMLNTMAAGGTYIMTQNNLNGPIFARHQRSTDVTSITNSELSITTALDYTAKFIRNSLTGYVGRNNITPNFIGLVSAVLNGIAENLKSAGVLSDLKINSVVQDELNPDTLLIEVEALVYFPGNYLKITLLY